MSRYSAQKQFWKAKQAKHEKDKIADVVLLQKLQVQETNTFLHTHLATASGNLTDSKIKINGNSACPIGRYGFFGLIKATI